MRALLSLWTWFEIALLALLGFWVELALFLVTWPFDRNRRIVGRTFRLSAVLTTRLTPFWKFGIEGPLPSPRPSRTVVVCNHESNADAFLISFLPWEMKWLGKSSLFKVPFVGWSMVLAGDVPVRRGEKDSAKGAMARCARWLERGMPVMMFPEGTRSKTEEMLPFKDGAFRLAIDCQADVLPIAIHGTRASLPKHSWRFSTARARVTVGRPISTRGMTSADIERLKGEARAQIEALRRGLALAAGEPVGRSVAASTADPVV